MVTIFDLKPEKYLSDDGVFDTKEWIKNNLSIYSENDLNILNQTLSKISTHPKFYGCLEICKILMDLGLDIDCVLSGTLFLIYVEDKFIEDYIKHNLKPIVITLLQELLIIEQLHYEYPLDFYKDLTKTNSENLRRLLLANLKDIRSLILKLAIHTYHMRTATKSKPSVQINLAAIATEIYSPLASRMGIGQIKWELEDYSLRYTKPETYKRIVKYLDEKRIDRETYLNTVKDLLHQELINHDISFQVNGRVKHIYSIWKKMQKKGLSYNQIYDVTAVRIIVKSVSDCYAVLGIVHSMWHSIANEFDDYIAKPKKNGYQSLHTAVNGPNGKVLEVQIRTQEQHEISELGVAAHWRYKEDLLNSDSSFENKLLTIRKALEDQSEIVIENEAVEALRTKFFSDRVYVFTPKGDVIDLPKGSTAIDFAYHLHSDLGHKCSGVKINNKIAPLSTPLPNGSHISIITSSNHSPSRDWLNDNLRYAITKKAKIRIAQWFKAKNRDKNIIDGKEILSRELKRLGFDNLSIKLLVDKVKHCNNEEDLYAGIGNGEIKISKIMGALARISSYSSTSIQKTPEFKSNIKISKNKVGKNYELIIDGFNGLSYHIARCCNPIEEDPCLGYITLGKGITVHKASCANISKISIKNSARLVPVKWKNDDDTKYCHSKITVTSIINNELIDDIKLQFNKYKIDIIDVETKNSLDDNLSRASFMVKTKNIKFIMVIVEKIQEIPGVIEVFRSKVD